MTKKEKRVIPRRLDEIVVPASIFLDRLTDFLGSSDGQTTEEVKAELREQGIDIDSFLSEAKAKIKTHIWHRKYKDCMIASAGLTEEEAQACLDAGMGEYDYSEDPEESALMEMSYWTD